MYSISYVIHTLGLAERRGGEYYLRIIRILKYMGRGDTPRPSEINSKSDEQILEQQTPKEKIVDEAKQRLEELLKMLRTQSATEDVKPRRIEAVEVVLKALERGELKPAIEYFTFWAFGNLNEVNAAIQFRDSRKTPKDVLKNNVVVAALIAEASSILEFTERAIAEMQERNNS